eukprot:8163855-Alexandrium_andersonii.AAC.1
MSARLIVESEQVPGGTARTWIGDLDLGRRAGARAQRGRPQSRPRKPAASVNLRAKVPTKARREGAGRKVGRPRGRPTELPAAARLVQRDGTCTSRSSPLPTAGFAGLQRK